MTGYTRQSAADIVAGAIIEAEPLNAEFDALQTAFGAVTGHSHDGTTGNGPKINLTTSVSGILPAANGGTGASSLTGAGLVTLTGTQTLTNKTLTSPTINSGALSGTFSGDHTYSGRITSSFSTATGSTSFMSFTPTDFGTGKPSLSIHKSSTATQWNFLIYDGVDNTGTINFVSSALTYNSVPIVTTTGTQTLTNKTLTSPTINGGALSGTFTGTHTYSGVVTITGGALNVQAAGGNVIELGRIDGSSSTPAIDFHSGATAVDYDVRMIASGGTGSSGGGVLNIQGGQLQFNSSDVMTRAASETVTGLKTITLGNGVTLANYLRLLPSDYGSSNYGMVLQKSATGNRWNINIDNSVDQNGILDFGVSTFTQQNVPIVTTTGTQTLTNKTIVSPALTSPTIYDGYTEETYTANTSTAITIDLGNGSFQILTLTGNCTFTFPSVTPAGRSFTIFLKQDGTGSRTATWPSVTNPVKWPNSTTPTITSTASKADLLAFTSDGTNWIGRVIGQVYL